MNNQHIFTGSRVCPSLASVTETISFLRKNANQIATVDVSQELSPDLVPAFNFAVLYLLWHQFFSIATRGICLPYVPLTQVSLKSGVGTLADKDSGDGYKARLTWMRPKLLVHMKEMESLVDALARTHGINRSPADAKIFFLNDKRAVDVTPSRIEALTSDIFFPFPSNTPRHVMRFLLRESGATDEVIEAFMGHWQARREPWGKFSSFDFSAYLADIRVRVPKILDDLGFTVPRFRRSLVRHR